MEYDISKFDLKELNLIPLKDFLAGAKSALTLPDRETIIDQALIIIEEAYVHLPLKKAMFGIDPVQRLKLLKFRNNSLSEREFNTEMLSIFVNLRDLHTSYYMPDPYSDKVALLPFQVEEYYEGDKPYYIVSKMIRGFDHPTFKEGVILKYWNGIPIDLAIEINGFKTAGGNREAMHMRGVDQLTIRPLFSNFPPAEEWVNLIYISNNTEYEIKMDWQIFTIPPDPPQPQNSSKTPNNMHNGVDKETENIQKVKKCLFSRPSDLEKSSMPDNFKFMTAQTKSGEFGYIRVFSFATSNDDDFVNEFIRILGLLPQNGLIIDVRGNGGGRIPAGEKILQLLTPKKIQPEYFHFVNTPLTLKLCKTDESLTEWEESIETSIETGSVYSQGFSLLPVEEYNKIGQKYKGPVILIIDALCYSTTDIFTAGFKDHEIGTILGTSGKTGAGGANVWTLEALHNSLGDNIIKFPLPKNAYIQVALRRSTRVGKMLGVPLEDLGVRPGFIHLMTKDDVLHDNIDLIEKAGSLLKH